MLFIVRNLYVSLYIHLERGSTLSNCFLLEATFYVWLWIEAHSEVREISASIIFSGYKTDKFAHVNFF